MMMRCTFLALALILSAVFAASYADDVQPCTLNDYIASYGSCSSDSQTRSLQYVLDNAATCTGAQSIPSTPFDESCSCTVEDFAPLYSDCSNGVRSIVNYTKLTDCDGGFAPPPTPISNQPCQCTADDVESTFTRCNVRTQMRQIISYFRQVDGRPRCNSDGVESLLPSPQSLACNTSCAPGEYLKPPATQCQQCKAGTFSLGGGERWVGMQSWPKQFASKCVGIDEESCSKWTLQDGLFYSGKQSDDDGITFNSLSSSLSLSDEFVRDGYIEFTFRVDAERDFDGLTFSIDGVESLPLTSYTFTPTTLRFNVSAGVHTFLWEYTKDLAVTVGEDAAYIREVSLVGTAYFDDECTPCPTGSTAKKGAEMCTLCKEDTYADVEGSPKCKDCNDDEYALTGYAECIKRPNCTENDIVSYYTPCRNGKRTYRHTYSSPHICSGGVALADDEHGLECAECEEGTYRVEGSDSCQDCEDGYVYSNSTSSCNKCPTGTAAIRQRMWDNFAWFGNGLPETWRSGCSGDCIDESLGWRLAVNQTSGESYIDSSLSSGRSAQVWFAFNLSLSLPGAVSYTPEINSYSGRLILDVDGDTKAVDNSFSKAPGTPTVISNLLPGDHEFRWTFLKENAQEDGGLAKIFRIQITGTSSGGAPECVNCLPGTACPAGTSVPEECPPGSSSSADLSSCTPCPRNYYTDSPGSPQCIRCGSGTTTEEGNNSGGATECSLNGCTYTYNYTEGGERASESRRVRRLLEDGGESGESGDLTTSFTTSDDDTSLDTSTSSSVSGDTSSLDLDDELSPSPSLSPATSASPTSAERETDASPTPSATAAATHNDDSDDDNDDESGESETPGEREIRYHFANISQKDTITYMWGPLVDRYTNAFFLSPCNKNWAPIACGADAHGRNYSAYGCSVLHDRGHSVSLGSTISFSPLSPDSPPSAGFLVSLTNGTECSNGPQRSASIAMHCNPDSGVGFPALSDPFESECHYSFEWESAYACPQCTERDWQRVVVPCQDGQREVKYAKKQGVKCFGGFSKPEIEIEQCVSCTKDDFIAEDSSCVSGHRYRRYHIREGIACQDDTDVRPETEVLECEDWEIERGVANAGFALAGIFFIALAVTLFTLWRKHRKLYSQYQLLSSQGGHMEMETLGEEIDDLDSDVSDLIMEMGK